MLFSESEFRDPSTYASFYYPPEGPDTEKEQSEAEEEAQSVVEEDAAAFQEALQQNYPGAIVKGTVGEVTDEDVDEGRDYYHYTAYVKCNLEISIPKEVFAGKTDDEIFDLIPDICATEAALEIDYDDNENEDVTDTSVEITMTGQYKYYFENDRDYDDYDEDRDAYDPYY
jgi:hypothetical protein